jgi:hypothetical protein
MNISCTGKVKYGTWARAQKDASFSKIRWGDVLHPYRCKVCGSYHIGSSLREEFDDDREPRHFRTTRTKQRAWS